ATRELEPRAAKDLEPRATFDVARGFSRADVAEGRDGSNRSSELRVVNPPDGAVYLIDPTLRREFQTIGLRGAAGAKTRIGWRVDGESVGARDVDAALDWPMTPGHHVISAHDATGRRAESAIVVK